MTIYAEIETSARHEYINPDHVARFYPDDDGTTIKLKDGNRLWSPQPPHDILQSLEQTSTIQAERLARAHAREGGPA